MGYLDLNRGLYVEGNNWCGDHRQTDFFTYFNIEFITVGQDNEVTQLIACEDDRFGERVFGYQTGNYGANIPDRIRPIGGAEQIFTCNREFARGVFNDGEGAFRTYALSVSFINMNNNYDHDRAEFLVDIINELAGYQGTFTGRIVNNMTDEPVAGALVEIPECNLSCVTDEDGNFFIDRVPIEAFRARVSARGYTTVDEAEFTFEGEQEIEVEIRMLHPEMTLDPYEIVVDLEPEEEIHLPIHLTNPGDGPLDFSAMIRAMRAEGHLWEEIVGYNVGETTDDTRLQASIFFQDHYWVAGGGSGADNPNILYKLNRDGELVEQWEQASVSNYGWRDLTEDGEFIYGVDDTYIAQISPETGMVTGIQFPSILNPTSTVAWDEANGLFWISGTTTSIFGIDREGNQVMEVTNRGRFRTSGLFYFEEDPDGYPLYVMSTNRERQAIVYKVDPETDEALEVVYLPIVEGEKPGGCDITQELYPFTWTAVIQMQGPEDWLRTFETYTDFYWLSLDPIEAQVEGGNEMDFDLTLSSTGLEIDNTYTAHIMFEHNTPLEEMLWIDVTLNTIEEQEDGVNTETAPPLSFGIHSAYPNPFNPETTLNFSLDRAAHIQLAIYDLTGRTMTTLVDGWLSADDYNIPLTADDWSSGIYMVRLTDGERVDMCKLTLIK